MIKDMDIDKIALEVCAICIICLSMIHPWVH